MTTSLGTGGTEPLRGRTTIASRAIRRVASAVTAEALGVPSSHVGVELTDSNGELAVALSAPIRLAPLTPGGQIGDTGTLLERAAVAKRTVAHRLGELSGRTIGRVDLRLSGAHITKERRVK